MNIKGKVVTLRAIEENDMKLLKDMMNDGEIERLVGGWAFPISLNQQKKWYESSINNDRNIRLIIETEEDGAIGLATIVDIDWKNRVAFHGIKLANKKYRARGIGTDSVMAVMRYAFDELQLNRLDGAIIEYNEGSKKLYCEKCGWKVEGVQRNKIYKNGKFHDRVMVGVLKEDYKQLLKEKNYWCEK
ncbi:MAG: GNAT family N-acetyltransferase [Clostridium sp.]|uniref:GNAT family N-acetyltransferase n=1 Tax=Clostridium sp. TaxID=1506 RepID=UPI003F3C96E8